MLCSQLGSFLIFHLWSFDRFNCLRYVMSPASVRALIASRWNHGPHSGAFKRIMTVRAHTLSIPSS